MCGFLSPSCPSPSYLHVKGPASTVPLQPNFDIAVAFASSEFSYFTGYLTANLVSISTTANVASSLDS